MREGYADAFGDRTEAASRSGMVTRPVRAGRGARDGASHQITDRNCKIWAGENWADENWADENWAHKNGGYAEHFTHLLLTGSDSKAFDFIDVLLRDGATAHLVFTDVLSPSAKLLGTMWLQDACSFVDVTLGLAAIHRVLYREADRLGREIDVKPHDRAIFITPLPGEDHIFAAALLGEYFRAARWTVRSGVGDSRDTIVQTVRRQLFDVVGVTVSSEQKIPDCKQLIRDIREHSLNRNVKILAGGPPFLESQVTCDDVHSDATAKDAGDAVRVATAICEDLTHVRC